MNFLLGLLREAHLHDYKRIANLKVLVQSQIQRFKDHLLKYRCKGLMFLLRPRLQKSANPDSVRMCGILSLLQQICLCSNLPEMS